MAYNFLRTDRGQPFLLPLTCATGSPIGVLLYGYAIGVRSSRQLERRCQEDLACWALPPSQQRCC